MVSPAISRDSELQYLIDKREKLYAKPMTLKIHVQIEIINEKIWEILNDNRMA